jgi:alpha-glucosidase
VLGDGYPFVYVRGGRYLVAVNPADRTVRMRLSHLATAHPVENAGITLADRMLTAEPFARGIFALVA